MEGASPEMLYSIGKGVDEEEVREMIEKQRAGKKKK